MSLELMASVISPDFEWTFNFSKARCLWEFKVETEIPSLAAICLSHKSEAQSLTISSWRGVSGLSFDNSTLICIIGFFSLDLSFITLIILRVNT